MLTATLIVLLVVGTDAGKVKPGRGLESLANALLSNLGTFTDTLEQNKAADVTAADQMRSFCLGFETPAQTREKELEKRILDNKRDSASNSKRLGTNANDRGPLATLIKETNATLAQKREQALPIPAMALVARQQRSKFEAMVSLQDKEWSALADSIQKGVLDAEAEAVKAAADKSDQPDPSYSVAPSVLLQLNARAAGSVRLNGIAISGGRGGLGGTSVSTNSNLRSAGKPQEQEQEKEEEKEEEHDSPDQLMAVLMANMGALRKGLDRAHSEMHTTSGFAQMAYDNVTGYAQKEIHGLEEELQEASDKKTALEADTVEAEKRGQVLVANKTALARELADVQKEIAGSTDVCTLYTREFQTRKQHRETLAQAAGVLFKRIKEAQQAEEAQDVLTKDGSGAKPKPNRTIFETARVRATAVECCGCEDSCSSRCGDCVITGPAGLLLVADHQTHGGSGSPITIEP